MPSLLARLSEPLIAQLFSHHRVHRLHDVEAVLYCSDRPDKPVGHWCESRWSNGLGSFTLRIEDLPDRNDGAARLYSDGTLVAGFDFYGRRLAFRWLGKLTGDMPGFSPGQQIRLQVAGMEVLGTVTRH